jgi:hypothetical protein
MLLDKIRVRQRQPLRRLAQDCECASVGAGSPWPVAMIWSSLVGEGKITWTVI